MKKFIVSIVETLEKHIIKILILNFQILTHYHNKKMIL
jgi:hypothetical protein